MAIEIVDFPIKNGGSFHSYVNVYQRVAPMDAHLLRDLDALVIFQHRLPDGRPTGTLRSLGDVARGILERDVACHPTCGPWLHGKKW